MYMYVISSPVTGCLLMYMYAISSGLIRTHLLKKKQKNKKTFKTNVVIRSRTWPEKKAIVSEINRWTVTTKRFYTCCSGQENIFQSTNTCEQSKCTV